MGESKRRKLKLGADYGKLYGHKKLKFTELKKDDTPLLENLSTTQVLARQIILDLHPMNSQGIYRVSYGSESVDCYISFRVDEFINVDRDTERLFSLSSIYLDPETKLAKLLSKEDTLPHPQTNALVQTTALGKAFYKYRESESKQNSVV